jgi:hypothetical protein
VREQVRVEAGVEVKVETGMRQGEVGMAVVCRDEVIL